MNSLTRSIKNSGDELFRYIMSVDKIPLLTEEEELYYAKKKDEGDINAAKMLVSSHLRFVVKIATMFKNYGLPLMDLISEGNIGLMRAVRTYDYKKGYKLATYSMWWIRSYIQEYILRTWSIVKIGTNEAQKKLFFNLRKIKNKILSYNSRKYLNNDDVKQISESLNVTRQDVVDMDSRISSGDFFLNQRINDEDGSEIMDLIPAKQPLQDVVVDNKRIDAKEMKLLNESLNILNEREREIIKLRKLTDTPLTLSEISKKCNVSGERVRQIEARAIEKMKNYILNVSSK